MNDFDRTTAQGTDAGLLVLRLALAAVFLAHSVYLKLAVFTLPGTAAFCESLGLPAFSAYLVFTAEAVGGVLLALGVFTRPTAALLAVVSATEGEARAAVPRGRGDRRKAIRRSPRGRHPTAEKPSGVHTRTLPVR